MLKPGHLFHTDHDHERCVRTALERAEQLCRERGARLTPIRRRVLELLWSSHQPIGAYELLERLKQDGPAAPPTVYRALDFLLELGLAHRVATLNAFVGCCQPGRPHQGQFLICRSCRRLDELPDAGQVSASIEAASKAAGFWAEERTVEIFGLCARCREDRHDGKA